jgi:hypothetical protein
MEKINKHFVRITIVILNVMVWAAPDYSQEVGNKESQLSTAKPVPIGELEAVGTIPGCTATLITNNLVLTAAHCVCPSGDNALNCQNRVTFTLHDVFPVDNPQTTIDESKTRRDISIDGTVRIHPEYTMRGWQREDYAVIELDQPATALAKVTPIPVEEPFNVPLEGEILTLVGYGLTGADCKGPSLGKMKLDLPVTVSGWGGISFKNAKLHACPGDSGGPILNQNNHVVGVASWIGAEESTYRPTSYAYNWILGIPQSRWSSCSWVPIESAGINSHNPATLCPEGSFLTAFDLNGDRNIDGRDAPIIGQARCCKVAGAENLNWGLSAWVKIEQAGLNSHSQSGAWCPNGFFITGIDLDSPKDYDPQDSPVIGQVRCSQLAGSQNMKWGSTYWMEVGGMSHVAGSGWCLDGAFITQIDLDRAPNSDAHDSPIVGRVKCSCLQK